MVRLPVEQLLLRCRANSRRENDIKTVLSHGAPFERTVHNQRRFRTFFMLFSVHYQNHCCFSTLHSMNKTCKPRFRTVSGFLLYLQRTKYEYQGRPSNGVSGRVHRSAAATTPPTRTGAQQSIAVRHQNQTESTPPSAIGT